jgi:hypothetical protein
VKRVKVLSLKRADWFYNLNSKRLAVTFLVTAIMKCGYLKGMVSFCSFVAL